VLGGSKEPTPVARLHQGPDATELRRGLGIFGASMLVILTLYAGAALLLLHSLQVFLFTAVPAVIIAVVGLRRAGVLLRISARQSGSSAMVVGVANDIGRTSGLIFLLKLWLTWPVAWIFPLLGVMDAIDVVNNRPTATMQPARNSQCGRSDGP
jgi:hypothetical protein